MRLIWPLLVVAALQAQALSEWVFGGPDHRLHYRYDARGNSIMDFSSAGYRGGGVKLPAVPAAERLTPAPGDNTAAIQAALDRAAGAVVLGAGEYQLAGTLSITRSGAVLRGEKGAVIRLTGRPHRFLEIHGTGAWHEEGPHVPVADSYVPAGATGFRVRDAGAFHPGDRVLVLHPVTAAWLNSMGMDLPVHDGHQTSLAAGSVIRTDRVVDSVSGDRVTLDVPLSDALDSQYTAASLTRYSFAGRISEVGVEGLRIVAPVATASIPGQQFTALLMDAVEDGWARDLEIQDTQNGIVVGAGVKRATLTGIHIVHTAAPRTPAAPADFSLQGTQILMDRCSVSGQGTTPAVAESGATGPIVVLNFTADHGGFEPHQRWATGLLVDGGKFPGGTETRPGVEFSNRGAEGWSAGWSVAWNVSSPFLLLEQPPAAMNWCIGCTGAPVANAGGPSAIFDSAGKPVEPASLYLQQLRDRIGPEAVRNTGY